MITSINEFKMFLEGADDYIKVGKIYITTDILHAWNDEFDTEHTFDEGVKLTVNMVIQNIVTVEETDGNDREWDIDLDDFYDSTMPAMANGSTGSGDQPGFTITGEYEGEPTEMGGQTLLNILRTNDEIANGVEDFIKKVTTHITDETDSISDEDRQKLRDWFETQNAAEEMDEDEDEDEPVNDNTSLGTYTIQDGLGICKIDSRDARHSFTKEDFIKWANSGEQFVDGIDDLIIDAIMSRYDDVEDPNDLRIYNKRFFDRIDEIAFEWEHDAPEPVDNHMTDSEAMIRFIVANHEHIPPQYRELTSITSAEELEALLSEYEVDDIIMLRQDVRDAMKGN